MKDCTQINIPTVDNTPVECEDNITDACIVIEEAIPFLGSQAGIRLKELIYFIVENSMSQQRQINTLKTIINNLNTT